MTVQTINLAFLIMTEEYDERRTVEVFIGTHEGAQKRADMINDALELVLTPNEFIKHRVDVDGPYTFTKEA
jgi:hypothetical protein